jgi:hypothetical protein
MCPVPTRDGDHGDHCGEREQDGPDSGGRRPGSEEARSAREREHERPEERARERDPVAVRLKKWWAHVGFVLLREGNP